MGRKFVTFPRATGSTFTEYLDKAELMRTWLYDLILLSTCSADNSYNSHPHFYLTRERGEEKNYFLCPEFLGRFNYCVYTWYMGTEPCDV